MTAKKPKRALVTGASRGLGAAIARALAARGHHVVLNCRSNVEAARAVLAEIEQAGGSGSVSPFDVRDPQATGAAIESILEDGPVQIVVNNAGIIDDAPLPTLSIDAWHAVTRTTLDGFYNVTRPLVMPMVRTRWGRIINMSSIAGQMGNRGQVNYSAAKAGIIGATKALSQELAKRNITVNAVAPGLIETEMTAAVPKDMAIKMIPMRRFGQPEEVASLVDFLCSDEAAYITGQAIAINGGMF